MRMRIRVLFIWIKARLRRKLASVLKESVLSSQVMHYDCVHHKPRLIRTLTFPQKKERYPIYIVRSDRQYRENRSMILSALIGKNFRTLRGHRQLTLEQVAVEIGISVDILHQLESGSLEVTPTMLVIISDYFGVVIDYLIYQDLSIEQ